MAVSKKSGTPGRLDFSTALNEAVGEGVIKTPAPVKNPEQIKPSTITIEERTTQSADDTLAMKVAERAKKITLMLLKNFQKHLLTCLKLIYHARM